MIDLIIILMYIAIAAAILATVWAVVRTARVVGRTSGMVHGVPVRKINIAVMATIALTLLLSFAFADTQPMHIGSSVFNDAFWLRMANMFVFTATIAIVIATAATIYNFLRLRK